MKRIRLTIESPMAVDEVDWAEFIRRLIEEADPSGLTRVAKVELSEDFSDATYRFAQDSVYHP